jgi:cysteine-rich repeat protein
MRSPWAHLTESLFARRIRRVGVRVLALAALAFALAGVTACEQIVGFGDHALEPACGDGAIGLGEECDDGNKAGGDGCSAACVVEGGYVCMGKPSVCSTACGDGKVAPAEGCDDGNAGGGDGCSSVCSVETGFTCGGSPSACEEVCGDGLVVGAEGCDDQNQSPGDGCSSACAEESGYSCSGAPSACAEVCGDGLVVGAEGCDDQNPSSGDGCSSTCAQESGYSCSGAPSGCVAICGDGLVVGAESCDDQNPSSGDGCSSTCAQESGYSCSGAPSACVAICGDGLVVGAESCDDQNPSPGDGCSAACLIEAGYACSGAPSACAEVCGDGLVVGAEGCDDQNKIPGDGCDAACSIEVGYACSGAPSACSPVCGDNLIVGGEACDDGDTTSFDGCSAACAIESGYACDGQPSVCVSTCGDGVLAVGAEQCDDGAQVADDCCSPTCQLEAAGCESEPNNTSAQANDFAALSVAGTMKAVIKPSADIDVFRLTVPPSGVADLTAETLDGPFGSTCANMKIDTKISIRNGAGAILASDDDTGPGLCSIASLTGLPPGDYFIEVIDSPAGGALSFDYSLKVTFKLAVCGNGAKEGLEQCDDGNTMSGDGCSPVCLFEMESEDEAGGNNSCQDTSGPYSPPVLIAGAITPIGDVDYFAFTVPAVADVRVETFGPAGPGSCAAPINTQVELRGQDCASILVADDDDGLGGCSLINPASAADAGARHLPPGTYFVRVEELGNNAEIVPGYSAYITFTALLRRRPEGGIGGVRRGVPPDGDVRRELRSDPGLWGSVHRRARDVRRREHGERRRLQRGLPGGGASSPRWSRTGRSSTRRTHRSRSRGDTFVTGSVGDRRQGYFQAGAGPGDGAADGDVRRVAPRLRGRPRDDAALVQLGRGAALRRTIFRDRDCSALVVVWRRGRTTRRWRSSGTTRSPQLRARGGLSRRTWGRRSRGNDGTLNATPVAGSDVFISGVHHDQHGRRLLRGEGAGELVHPGRGDRGQPRGDVRVERDRQPLTLFDPNGLPLVSGDDGGRGLLLAARRDGIGAALQRGRTASRRGRITCASRPRRSRRWAPRGSSTTASRSRSARRRRSGPSSPAAMLC